MPILQVKLSTTPSPVLSQQVATVLGELTAQLLHKQPDVTVVTVDYVDPKHWLLGGRSLAEQGLVSFFLDIKVTAGTNTKDEKAAYQQQVFARLGELFGPLHPTSYVQVHDVRAEAWGYGGLTQEFRYIKRQLSALVVSS
jgi:4-oxalocrotonate tautomerase